MKQFLLQKNLYKNYYDDKTFHYIIETLIIMIAYRILKDGVLPCLNGSSFLELLLPVFLILACILLCYGAYYIGEHYFSSNHYQEEECFIDGILLGLLLPIHTPILMILLAVFMTVIVGRYLYQGQFILVPVLVGIISTIVVSVILRFFDITNEISIRLLFEYTEFINVHELSATSIWSGFVGDFISKTSSLLCIMACLFLILKKAIKWRIPIYFVGSYILLFVISNFFIPRTIMEIVKNLGSGNLLFLSLFVATNQRSTPITFSGQILFGCLLGLFTYIGSYFFTPFLSMILSILLLNLLVPVLDYFGNYYQLKYCSQFGIKV